MRMMAASQQKKPTVKIDGTAFLYMEPKEPKDQFAQCATCVSWTDDQRCAILGSNIPVAAGDTCGLYVHGKWDQPIDKAAVSTGEAGFEHRQVRCENCKYFDPQESDCELFSQLNDMMPDVFKINEKVDAKGCCNANTPR